MENFLPKRHLSISHELGGSKKRYLSLLSDSWAETGVGAGGDYARHRHLGFTDVMYSPTGLRIGGPDGRELHGRLLVIAPRAWFGPVAMGPFWFIKFFQSTLDATVKVPDKQSGDGEASQGRLEFPYFLADMGSIELPRWDPAAHAYGSIAFRVDDEYLLVEVPGEPSLIIRR